MVVGSQSRSVRNHPLGGCGHNRGCGWTGPQKFDPMSSRRVRRRWLRLATSLSERQLRVLAYRLDCQFRAGYYPVRRKVKLP